jgi:hypothetical protein
MKLYKAVSLLAVIVSASITPAFAQISWGNQSPSGISDDIWCATYADGTFAATTNQGKILTSADGLTWSSQTVASGTWLVSIAYGNGKWVAVGAGGTIVVSSDLQNWVYATSATTNKLNGVLYNGTIWAAVGEADTIITSPDAITWTVQTVPAALGLSGFLHGITWDQTNNVFLITGSETGTNTSPYGNYSGGVMLQMTSSGAISETIPPTSSPLESVMYESTLTPNTVVVGDNGVIFSGSYGASTPTIASVPNVTYRGVTYGNGYWVAAGAQGTLLSSTDGVNWTQRFSGNSPQTLTTATLLGATYSSTLQRFVVVGSGGTILVSNSLPTVFINVSTRGYVDSAISGALLDGGFVISGTAPRQVLIRGDGPVLSTFGVSGSLPDPVVTVYNSAGTIVGSNTVWTSNTNSAAIATAALEVGAFALPSTGKDSALLLTLAPGAYTVEITSAGNNSGIALFEAYAD